jgi:CheY-like chemotaxis protein
MRRRLLVADDSSTIQKVIKIAFNRFPVELIEASSFLDALTSIGQDAPEALIIDASLPGARSPSDFERLRQEAQGAPVLLLIGSYESVDEAAFRQAGFNNMLKKPFESADIIAAIEALVETPLSNQSPTLPPPPVSAPARATSAVPPRPSMPKIPAPPVPAPPPIVIDSDAMDIGATELTAQSLTSQDRARHATVIHSGGFPGLPALDGLSSDSTEPFADVAALTPQVPLVPEGQRGRRVFNPENTDPFGNKAGAQAGAASQPVSPSIAEIDFDLRLDEMDSAVSLMPGTAVPSQTQYNAPPPPPFQMPPMAPRKTYEPDDKSTQFSPDLVDTDPKFSGPPPAQMPNWVRQAVEDYCERHFKSLAREVITAELRRLADEKARHLVDN